MITIELQAEEVMNLLKLIEVSKAVNDLRNRELKNEVVRYNEWEVVYKHLAKHIELAEEANNKMFTQLLHQYKDENG